MAAAAGAARKRNQYCNDENPGDKQTLSAIPDQLYNGRHPGAGAARALPLKLQRYGRKLECHRFRNDFQSRYRIKRRVCVYI